MVEEFMLLANVATAEKTLSEFPNCAMLRRHPAPPPSNFDPLIKAAESKVYHYNVKSIKPVWLLWNYLNVQNVRKKYCTI